MILFGVSKTKREFHLRHPNEQILAADACKAIITGESENIKRSTSWITAKRAVIILTDKRIKCGEWEIPLSTIESSELIKFYQGFIPGYVLKIQSREGTHYQFEMQLNKQWVEQTVLPLTPRHDKLGNSIFSVVIRIILLAAIVYWLIRFNRG